MPSAILIKYRVNKKNPVKLVYFNASKLNQWKNCVQLYLFSVEYNSFLPPQHRPVGIQPTTIYSGICVDRAERAQSQICCQLNPGEFGTKTKTPLVHTYHVSDQFIIKQPFFFFCRSS